MQCSEAIRLGSLLIENPEAGNTARCAVGMVLLANGKPIESHPMYDYVALQVLYPWLGLIRGCCPQCTGFQGTYALNLIWHIFDTHVMGNATMTIEQLADFVATLEPKPVLEQELCPETAASSKSELTAR